MLQTPSKEYINNLTLFPRVEQANISVVNQASQALIAYEVLKSIAILGFDTESKPTFVKDEISSGPHVVQFAAPHKTYVFQLFDDTCREVVSKLLTSPAIMKVGFGLSGDGVQIRRTLGIEPLHVLDINTLFKAKGYVKEIGVKTAVAVLFNQRLIKSRKTTTSNWANKVLTEAQMIYAANDAWAALKVYQALALAA
jgi:ribonuclease D